MNPLTFIYNEILFRPLFNLLVGITNIIPGHLVGVSILVVTCIVRIILIPPSLHQAKAMSHNQTKMKELKKDIDKINKKHKNDKAARAQATMELYKEAGVNPASGCLPLLIQFPILIALYRVFLTGIEPQTLSHLYAFVSSPEHVNTVFLGIELTSTSLLLAVIAGVFQFLHMKMITPPTTPTATQDDDTAQMMMSMQKNMAYIFPVMTVFIAIQLPAALALYWVATTIFGIVQQYAFKRFLNISTGSPA